jgi:hypothetical protein
MVITPPPVNEYQLEAFDASKGVPHPSRAKEQTKRYADAAGKAAISLEVPVADLWIAFTGAAGRSKGNH